MTRPAIVFTDLDGTLLDHETYSFAAARPALGLLKRRSVPLILASSKTAAEIATLREKVGFSHCPAIVENGAGILEPSQDPERIEGCHGALLAVLDALPAELRRKFSGFSEWTLEELAARTGLDRGAARNAARRRFSEPGIWSGSDADRAEFERLLAGHGVTARQGGRFLTLSFGWTKAGRMREIAGRYARNGEMPLTVALGDAPNDVEMLEAADAGVIVANPHRPPLPRLAGEPEGRITRTQKPGPEGWNDSVLRIFQDMQ